MGDSASAGSQLRVLKPKTRRGARALLKRAPRLVEELKKVLLLHGGKSSAILKEVLSDLGALKRGECLKLSRKNEAVRPFETGGEGGLEFLCLKADCSLFCLANHSKKRPHNLVLGRMFDFKLLDMLELGVENFKPLRAFGQAAARAASGSKPCLVFSGELFDTDEVMRTAKSLLIDLFRGRVVPSINLRGLDRVIICTALPGRILFRQAVTRFKKSGTSVPKVELTEMGPSMDLVLRRHRPAAPDAAKAAYTQPAGAKQRKNVGTDSLVGTVGRVFVPRQEVGDMALRKPKGVKRQRREAAADRSAKRQAAGDARGGGEGGEEGAGEEGGGRQKRRKVPAEAPAGPGYEHSPGNITLGKGLKKAARRPKRD